MKKISIFRIHKGLEIPQEMWYELLSFKSRMSINLLGFSEREVKYVDHSMNELIFICSEDLIDNFLNILCEASSCDFTYEIK